MKPRLKLNQGRLELVHPITHPLKEWQAAELIRVHYGTRLRFAHRWGFRYANVLAALRRWGSAHEQAGQTAAIRDVLGLSSNPSKASVRLVAIHTARREKNKGDLI